jgi:hypothetical protein
MGTARVGPQVCLSHFECVAHALLLHTMPSPSPTHHLEEEYSFVVALTVYFSFKKEAGASHLPL